MLLYDIFQITAKSTSSKWLKFVFGMLEPMMKLAIKMSFRGIFLAEFDASFKLIKSTWRLINKWKG